MKRKQTSKLLGGKEGEDNDEDEGDVRGVQNYQYKSIGNQDRTIQYQCNVQEIYFELINHKAGSFIRLECLPDNKPPNNMQKKNVYEAFQFNYDPIHKNFVRGLRDAENKDYVIDHNFVNWRRLKEEAKGLDEGDKSDMAKYGKMSYINYITSFSRQDKGEGSSEEDDENYLDDEDSLDSDNR